MFHAMRAGSETMADFLLAKGAAPSLEDEDGDDTRYLAAAARGGSVRLVKMALDMGADINQVTKLKRNALWIALFYGNEDAAQ